MIKSSFKKRIVFLGMLALITGSVNLLSAQTNPAPVNIPYSFTSNSGNTLPPGMAVHGFSSHLSSRTTSSGTSDLANVTANQSAGWKSEGNNGISLYSPKSTTGEHAGAIVVSVNTLCQKNLKIDWTVRVIMQLAGRYNHLALQYRIGNSGDFTDLGTANEVYDSKAVPVGRFDSYSLNLPAALENNPEVQFRWVFWDASTNETGGNDRLALDDVSITGSPLSTPPTLSGLQQVCVGATTTLTATGCDGTVTWSNGETGASIMAPAGTYTATCTKEGCVSEASSPITVNETPIAPPMLSGPSILCAGATANISASGCNGTVTWSTGETGASITAGPGVYTATCTSAAGCVSEPSIPFVMTETIANPPTITSGAKNCVTNQTELVASGCSGGTITWSTGATGSILMADSGSYTATCTVNGCVSAVSNAVIVTPCGTPCPAYPPPPPPPPPACVSGGLLVNGSFEDGAAPYPYSFTSQPGWTNEGEGNNGKIETWPPGTEGVYAPNGSKIVELNTTALGILTQSVVVAQNVPVTLSYYHRSRNAAGGEKLRIDIMDLTTNKLIHTFESTSTASWQQFSTMFTPTSNNIQIRIVSLNTCNNGLGDAGCGNLVDNFVMKYAACECPDLPVAPVICTPSSDLCDGTAATITALGCEGGTIKWSNGQTGPTLTTNVPGTYYAQCIMPGSSCNQSPYSNQITLGGCTDVSVTCPTFEWRSNGVFHIKFCVKNNGNAPASGTAYFKVNGVVAYTEYYSNLAAGATKCFIYRARYMPCGSIVNAEVGSTIVGVDSKPENNTCTGSQPMVCVPNPPPYDPNYKDAMPKRSLEGGIFPADEWITYTVHCQNDGLGVAHNVIMIDTIDITKLNIDSIEIVSSMDSVQFRRINNRVVAFDFMGVNLTSSHDDLPNSQTEVVFRIKRLPGQPIGTEILNKTGIYFDQEHVVETEYAFSKIIEPCPATDVHPGAVSSDRFVKKGDSVDVAFMLSGEEGIITGWEISTDPAFENNVTRIENYTNEYVFDQVVDSTTYIRALVQTGGCAIMPSATATIYPLCGNLIGNGSFENPVSTNGWAILATPSWTNLVDGNKIEIHRNYLGSPSEGSQYIELNGNARGTIYQDVSVMPGKTIRWKLDHRANTTSTEKITVTLSAPDGTNSQSLVHQGITNLWESCGDAYNIAAGQTIVRLKIASTTSPNSYMGNFIDNVSMEYTDCSVTTMSASVSLPDVSAADEETTISVSPNPVANNASIMLKGFETGAVNVTITDATGRTLKTLQYNYNAGTPYIVDLAMLKSGFYLIKVDQNGKSATAKVLKN